MDYNRKQHTDNRMTVKEILDILDRGSYKYNNKKIDLHLHTGIYDFEQATVLDANQLSDILVDADEFMKKSFYGPENHKVEVTDTTCLEEALKVYRPFILSGMDEESLLRDFLENKDTCFAWLCRTTSLSSCFCSKAVSDHFSYSHSRYGTKGMLFCPSVAVFCDSKEKLLEHPYPVSILCAGMCNDYSVVKERIRMFLLVAARNMYRNIILTDWVAEDNKLDACRIAECFREVLMEEEYCEYFEQIIFALGKSKNWNSLSAFRNAFGFGGSIEARGDVVHAATRVQEKQEVVEKQEFCPYIQFKRPMPHCNYKITEKELKYSLGYVQGVFEDGLPFVAELVHSKEAKQTNVIFVLPYTEKLKDNKAFFSASKYKRIDYQEGVEKLNRRTVLCQGMYDIGENVSPSSLNSFIDYLVSMGALNLKEHIIEVFARTLYDFKNQKVISIEISLIKKGVTQASTPFMFQIFHL